MIVIGFKSNFNNLTKIKKKINVGARYILLATIDSKTHHQVPSCKTAKDIYDELIVDSEGTCQEWDTLVAMIVNDF